MRLNGMTYLYRNWQIHYAIHHDIYQGSFFNSHKPGVFWLFSFHNIIVH